MEEEDMTTDEKRKKMVEGIVSAPADAVAVSYTHLTLPTNREV